MAHSLNFKAAVLYALLVLVMLLKGTTLSAEGLDSKAFSESFFMKKIQKLEHVVYSGLHEAAHSKDLKNQVAKNYFFTKKQNETIALADCEVSVATCAEGCSKLTLHVPPIWEGNTTVLWSPMDYLDDPTSHTPVICDPADSITYTATITHIPSSCFSVTTTKVTVNRKTPEATVKDSVICGVDNPMTPFPDNILDLNELITSGFKGGFWTDSDNSGGLSGSIFTAGSSMINGIFNFTYTIPGAQGNSGAVACDDRIYNVFCRRQRMLCFPR